MLGLKTCATTAQSLNYIFKGAYVVFKYMCVPLCAFHVCVPCLCVQVPSDPEEGIRFLGAGVIGAHGSPDVGAGIT